MLVILFFFRPPPPPPSSSYSYTPLYHRRPSVSIPNAQSRTHLHIVSRLYAQSMGGKKEGNWPWQCAGDKGKFTTGS